MQKIKFDFEATKERIYAPNSNVPIGAPVDRNGNIANDGNAYGIVLCKETENEKYWVKYNLVVMVAGYCDIIDAQAIWGDEYSAEAIAAMSDIVFCDNHKIGGGGGTSDCMDKVNPTGSGSFSLNRKPNTTIGEGSVAIGSFCTASGDFSFAEGYQTQATERFSHAEGSGSRATGQSSHAEGGASRATGQCSHAEGDGSTASGVASHAEGGYTKASSDYQHVQGKYNVEDTENKYALIIGNGTAKNKTHNCFMVGWDGAIYVQASDDATKMMKITVASDGTISATQA